MEIPVIKHLLRYDDSHDIIVDFIDFDSLNLNEIENIVVSNCPFTVSWDNSVTHNSDNTFCILSYAKQELATGKLIMPTIENSIEVKAIPVLEFGGKHFVGLQEIHLKTHD